jgi:hypothetical protein
MDAGHDPGGPGWDESDWFTKHFLSPRAEDLQPMVLPVLPPKINDRMFAQQGLFLCTNQISIVFEDHLKSVLLGRRDALHKFVIRPQARIEILRELSRMGITYASLFPDLDGFARSIGTCLAISDPLHHSSRAAACDTRGLIVS